MERQWLRPGVAPSAANVAVMLSALAVIAAALIALMPWIVGFVGAVAAAAIWCAWLDRHPGSASYAGRDTENGRRFGAKPAERLIQNPIRSGSQPTVH